MIGITAFIEVMIKFTEFPVSISSHTASYGSQTTELLDKWLGITTYL